MTTRPQSEHTNPQCGLPVCKTVDEAWAWLLTRDDLLHARARETRRTRDRDLRDALEDGGADRVVPIALGRGKPLSGGFHPLKGARTCGFGYHGGLQTERERDSLALFKADGGEFAGAGHGFGVELLRREGIKRPVLAPHQGLDGARVDRHEVQVARPVKRLADVLLVHGLPPCLGATNLAPPLRACQETWQGAA